MRSNRMAGVLALSSLGVAGFLAGTYLTQSQPADGEQTVAVQEPVESADSANPSSNDFAVPPSADGVSAESDLPSVEELRETSPITDDPQSVVDAWENDEIQFSDERGADLLVGIGGDGSTPAAYISYYDLSKFEASPDVAGSGGVLYLRDGYVIRSSESVTHLEPTVDPGTGAVAGGVAIEIEIEGSIFELDFEEVCAHPDTTCGRWDEIPGAILAADMTAEDWKRVSPD